MFCYLSSLLKLFYSNFGSRDHFATLWKFLFIWGEKMFDFYVLPRTISRHNGITEFLKRSRQWSCQAAAPKRSKKNRLSAMNLISPTNIHSVGK